MGFEDTAILAIGVLDSVEEADFRDCPLSGSFASRDECTAFFLRGFVSKLTQHTTNCISSATGTSLVSIEDFYARFSFKLIFGGWERWQN